MPIYEYVCPACKLKFQMLRPMSRSNENAACPECKKESGRVVSSFACCSTDSTGMTSAIGGGGSCGGCSSSSCATCGTAS